MEAPERRSALSRVISAILPTAISRLVLLVLSFALAPAVQASAYSVADARAQALAGTAIALGNPQQGFLYNPALLAMHDRDEDESQDGRYSGVLLLGAYSDGAETAVQAIDDDLEGQLSEAIAQLNQATTAESARAALATVVELGEAMRALQTQDIFTNLFTGFSVSEPGMAEGGAFFAGAYLIGAGRANIDPDDLDTLDDYVEALTFIESGGTQGQQHPELLDGNGNFIDPGNDVLSSADAAALIITEVGMAAAKKLDLWGQDIALGLAPKMVYVRGYNEQWGVDDGDFENDSDREYSLHFNADLGLLWSIKNHWRVGLSVRDSIAKSWDTSLGQSFKLRPRPQLGLAYWGETVRAGLDFDLDKRTLLQRGVSARELNAGLEVRVWRQLELRVGYSNDLEDTLGESYTGGLGLRLGRFGCELSYVNGEFSEGAALQFSYFQ